MLPMTVDFQSAEAVIVRKATDPMKFEKKKREYDFVFRQTG
jgi:hypothetical protein